MKNQIKQLIYSGPKQGPNPTKSDDPTNVIILTSPSYNIINQVETERNRETVGGRYCVRAILA